MSPIAYRMGVLAALRSLSLSGSAIGVMITASHNPEEDNGVKIVEPDGSMLVHEWEVYATELANSDNLEEMVKQKKTEIEEKCSHNVSTVRPLIVLGRDTRKSGPYLTQLVIQGAIELVGSLVIDLGPLTTPQLHFLVAHTNRRLETSHAVLDTSIYNKAFATAFNMLMATAEIQGQLVVDAANGIGAEAFKSLLKHLPSLESHTRIIHDGQGVLNYHCGADHVKVNQCPPIGLHLERGTRYASFDGDADRLVYYYADSNGHFRLLDGDKIASLLTEYLVECLRSLELFDHLKIGIVQTAYANGASTKYYESLGVEVAFASTGVKHLHAQAKLYDIGVYFEANGHGTVLFSRKCIQHVSDKAAQFPEASARMIHLMSLINPTVGDAISDLLVVESILALSGRSLAEWDALYHDLPNRLVKVNVQNRLMFQTTNADRTLTHPPTLQSEIDALVQKTPLGRAFARPSGTEDCVRVYAEAETRELADGLAYNIASLISSKYSITLP